jgi:5-methylthioribose kinase
MNPLETRLAAWRRERPAGLILSASDPTGLAAWLRSAGVLGAEEVITRLTAAGAGNMNCTLRVSTSRRSIIVKQARPWVEKYPQFYAPAHRASQEAAFYRLVGGAEPHSARLPRLLHASDRDQALVLEDLGPAGDYTDLYGGDVLSPNEIAHLAGWLSALHAGFLGHAPREALANREMRALNSRHIFSIPLEAGNGLDLDAITPGLAAGTRELRADAALRQRMAELARFYLADGVHLVHGDFFPGSLLRTPTGPKVIDPEFSHFGRAEFDTGVWLAHLRLASQPATAAQAWRCAYRPPPDFAPELMSGFMGAEIIRRLIGYAQLPLKLSLGEKLRLLEEARALVLAAPVNHPAAVMERSSSS